MAHQMIFADNAPAAVGPYCHAALCGNTLYVSGQLGLSPQDGSMPEGVENQATQALANLKAVLAAVEMTPANVVKTTVFLKNMGDFAAINAIYADFFGDNKPARSCVEVAALPKGALFEIEAIACK